MTGVTPTDWSTGACLNLLHREVELFASPWQLPIGDGTYGSQDGRVTKAKALYQAIPLNALLQNSLDLTLLPSRISYVVTGVNPQCQGQLAILSPISTW